MNQEELKMTKVKTIAAVTLLLALGACQSTGTDALEGAEAAVEEAGAMEDAGVSATDCFAAGGIIENAEGASKCKMQDGTFKSIL